MSHHLHAITPRSQSPGVRIADCIDTTHEFDKTGFAFWEVVAAAIVRVEKEVPATRILARIGEANTGSSRGDKSLDEVELVQVNAMEVWSGSEAELSDEDEDGEKDEDEHSDTTTGKGEHRVEEDLAEE